MDTAEAEKGQMNEESELEGCVPASQRWRRNSSRFKPAPTRLSPSGRTAPTGWTVCTSISMRSCVRSGANQLRLVLKAVRALYWRLKLVARRLLGQ